MSKEYIWFKNGKESKRTVDEDGELISKEILPDGTSVVYERNEIGIVRSKVTRRNELLQSIDGEPAITMYNSDGSLSEVGYYKDDELHRDGDKPAYTKRNWGGNIILSETYWKNGVKFRKGDKPSDISRREDGGLASEEWTDERGESVKGIIHKSSGETDTTTFSPDGSTYTVSADDSGLPFVENYKNSENQTHREGDKPAVIWYDLDGKTIEEEVWWINGGRHREGDKPADIRYRDGVVYFEGYYKNGDKHRDGGKPALVRHKADGTTETSYYNKGVKVTEGGEVVY